MLLNEEQRLLKNTIKGFLATNAPVDQLRELRDSHDELGYSKALWQQLVEMGITRAALPAAAGGLGFGWLGMGAIMETCGRNLSASPLLSSIVLGASLLELGGSEKQKQTLLEQVADGTLTLALAIDEGGHYAPLDCSTSLTKTDGGYRLQAKKVFVVDGHCADKLVVVARSAGKAGDASGLSLLLVDKGQTGVVIKRTIMMDGRNAANISFDNVELNASDLIGEADEAWPILQQVLDRGTACVAAEMLGGCLELFERTIDFLKEREQFGVKIGSFQALQHRAANMFCMLESCKSAVLNALASLDNGVNDAPLQVSLAKALANDCYQLISNEAVQLHGGMGVTNELDIGLFLKRARVCSQMFGDTDYHQDRYATLLGY